MSKVTDICKAVESLQGRAFMVGGSVRDAVLGVPNKDIDLEVYGVPAQALSMLLRQFGTVNTVGESFSVFKLRSGDLDIDVSIPRRESKKGVGHRGFEVTGDPFMPLEEAVKRRDFTMNALMSDPLTGELIDLVGGLQDIKSGVLRVVDPATFVDDSLRVLRAAQFAARFNMTVDLQTAALCRSIDLSDLPHERVFGEFEKMLLKAEKPSVGLQAMLDLGVLDKLFPEIVDMVGVPQEHDWHPEGDVFTHTKLSTDAAVELTRDLPHAERFTVIFAAMCHDLGKPATTEVIDGRIRSLGHEAAGVEPALSVMKTLGLHTLDGFNVRSSVLALVERHLRPSELVRANVGGTAYRRLSQKVDMELLHFVAKADGLGRGPASEGKFADEFLARAREAGGVTKGGPEPILMGRHLIEAGMTPGPRMGEVLKRVFEMQLDGQVTTVDEALAAAMEV